MQRNSSSYESKTPKKKQRIINIKEEDEDNFNELIQVYDQIPNVGKIINGI